MFRSIKEILPRSLKRAKIQNKIQAGLALAKFRQIVEDNFGPEIKSKFKPLYLKDGFLVIACLEDDLVRKIKKREKEIINKINEQIDSDLVKKLKFLN